MEEEYEVIEEKKSYPIATIIIVAATVLIFGYSEGVNPGLYEMWAANNQAIYAQGEWYRLVTAIFLHADVNHLFGNMILCVFLGEILERYVGRIRFVLIYLLSGILGNIFSQGWSYLNRNLTSSIGASGAVFGLVGTLLCLVLLHKGKLEQITMKRIFIMLFLSLYNGISTEHVDNLAHVAGFLAGFIVSGILVIPEYIKKKVWGDIEGEG